MKIAQIIPTLDRSGAEKQLLLLCRELKKRGHEVEVLVLTRTGELESEFRKAGIAIHIIGKPLKIDLSALLRLARLFRERDYDVIQSWLFAANSYSRAAARVAFGKFSQNKRPLMIATEMAVDLWKSKFHLMIDRKLAGYCDYIVGNSDAVNQFYRDIVGIEPEKLYRIYSGIENDEAMPITIDSKSNALHRLKITRENHPVILFAGRLAEQKRVEDLLKAADILQHLYPEMKVIIAGDGPLKTQLMQFSKDVALNDKVLFLGHFQDMNTLYAAADIVVLPSSYEGLPNVVLEAQLRSIPVVAAAAPGTTELVKHRETGLTHPVGDSTELARLLQELINQPQLAKELGAAGHQLVKKDFTVEKMADEFEKLYRQNR